MGADYAYIIRPHHGHKYIEITDLNKGNMSVTNDIENVVKAIIKKETIDVTTDFFIIYKDSDGFWDGWDYETKAFISLQTTSVLNAVWLMEQEYE
jgi:hypothetical protein